MLKWTQTVHRSIEPAQVKKEPVDNTLQFRLRSLTRVLG